jgi:hypothetical protein
VSTPRLDGFQVVGDDLVEERPLGAVSLPLQAEIWPDEQNRTAPVRKSSPPRPIFQTGGSGFRHSISD